MTFNEAAHHVHRSVETLRTWRKTGVGPPFAKVGRRLMIRRSDLDAWIDEQFKASA